jgi:multiple sugar transport system permease protein
LVDTSLKLTDYALNSPDLLQGPFGLDNYKSVLDQGFGYNLRNSLIVAAATTAFCVGIGSLAAYAIARLKMRRKGVILSGVLALSLFPPVALVPPLYTLWGNLNLLNTYESMIIPYIAFTLPLTIFILTSFFAALPSELEDAAKVDGAGYFQTFIRVIMPLAAPGVAAASILVFVYAWNEYLLASTFAPQDLSVQTVPTAIATFSGSVDYQRPIGTITAACVIVSVPMMLGVLALQKWIVSGLTAGGVKN